jgi:5-formyltetrahydrofolate cyclo-ligase
MTTERRKIKRRTVPVEEQKQRLRRQWLETSGAPATSARAGWGRAAERLRKLSAYRDAAAVLASPTPALFQVRVNVLADRKLLVIPTPALEKGFLLVEGSSIPFPKLRSAAFPGRDNRFAELMDLSGSPHRRIELMAVEALAAGKNGGILGDGSGHLDLQYAVLGTLDRLDPGVQVAALVPPDRVLENVPAAPGDVPAHWIVTPEGIERTRAEELPPPAIDWERLSEKRIRRSDTLFQLRNRSRDARKAGREPEM